MPLIFWSPQEHWWIVESRRAWGSCGGWSSVACCFVKTHALFQNQNPVSFGLRQVSGTKFTHQLFTAELCLQIIEACLCGFVGFTFCTRSPKCFHCFALWDINLDMCFHKSLCYAGDETDLIWPCFTNCLLLLQITRNNTSFPYSNAIWPIFRDESVWKQKTFVENSLLFVKLSPCLTVAGCGRVFDAQTKETENLLSPFSICPGIKLVLRFLAWQRGAPFFCSELLHTHPHMHVLCERSCFGEVRWSAWLSKCFSTTNRSVMRHVFSVTHLNLFSRRNHFQSGNIFCLSWEWLISNEKSFFALFRNFQCKIKAQAASGCSKLRH